MQITKSAAIPYSPPIFQLSRICKLNRYYSATIFYSYFCFYDHHFINQQLLVNHPGWVLILVLPSFRIKMNPLILTHSPPPTLPSNNGTRYKDQGRTRDELRWCDDGIWFKLSEWVSELPLIGFLVLLLLLAINDTRNHQATFSFLLYHLLSLRGPFNNMDVVFRPRS